MAQARTHLHAGTLTSESESSADGKDAADELDGNQHKWRGRQLAFEHRFRVRYPAARRARGEGANEAGGNRGGRGAGSDHREEPHPAFNVRALNKQIPKLGDLVQSESKARA